MPTTVETNTGMDRRTRFREYMRKLNPSLPGPMVIEAGLALSELHGSLYRTLAARADLEPDSQQIVVGGTGSGKTTELLLAQQSLSESGHTLPFYIDISVETDLSTLSSGALLASFGIHLARHFRDLDIPKTLPKEVRVKISKAAQKVVEFARGKNESIWVPDSDQPDEVDFGEDDEGEPGRFVLHQTPGKLSPRFPAIQRDIAGILEPLAEFLSVLRQRQLDVIAVFDGMDRLLSPEKFWAVADQDFRALRRLNVAVLAAAPISVLYGNGRMVSEHFDRVHHIAALNPNPDEDTALTEVLIHRGAVDAMDSSGMDRLVRASGGVLRDLISLARDACETAYVEGLDRVTSANIESVVGQLGESYLRGLGTKQLQSLRELAEDGSFDLSQPQNLELLFTRRVLEYSATDFRVHPSLAPLIPE